jgi:two-component system, cell cycle sensor histidine kinase and response regulator CckA
MNELIASAVFLISILPDMISASTGHVLITASIMPITLNLFSSIRGWSFLGLRNGQARTKDQKKAEEEYYRTFIENIEDGYYEVRPDGTFIYLNNYFSRLTGYRPKELYKQNLYSLLTNDCRDRVEETFRKIYRTGLPINHMEWTVLRRDGQRRTFEASITLRRLVTADEYVLRGIVRDITDRKETEDALLLGNRAMSATNNGIIITDPHNLNMVIYCNPAFEKITGYDRDEVIGRSYTMLYGPDTDIKTADTLRQALEEQRECRVIIRTYRKDDTPFWNEVTFSPVRDAAGNLSHNIGLINDLTERVQSEYKLRESEERFRKLLENANDVVSVVSEDGIVLFESAAVERILGYENAKYRVGKSLFDFVHPEDREREENTFREFANSPGAVQKMTLRTRHADGSWRFMECVGHNLLDNTKIQGIIINSRDVTDRKRLERQLIHAQKMESLGTLAAGVAHDFNNVLSILDGSLSLVKPHVKDEGILKYISMGELAVERGADVAGRLLTFARTEDIKIIPFELNGVVNELTRVLSHTIDKKVTIRSQIDPTIPHIKGDRGHIYQILLNLCINARDAILDKRGESVEQGVITIKATPVSRASLNDKYHDTEDDRYVRVTVSDNGTGMSEEVRQQIFDPFFTTKPAGKGTGLGMSVVYGMVKSHRGYIEIDSTEGEGTAVDVYLPALDVKKSDAQATTPTADYSGSETILVVEDEEMMITIVTEMLKSNGYNVLQARDGAEGYELFSKHRDIISAVILDMGLPKISGEDLFKKMKELDRSVRVVVASGFTDASLRETLSKDGVKAYIQKPYKPADILAVIRQVVDAER